MSQAADRPALPSLLLHARTIAIGLAGGAAFALLGLPAPWLSGPGLAVALAAMQGLPVEVPTWLRRPTHVFLGVLAGSALTPDSLALMGRWPATLAGLGLCVLAIMASIAFYLERVHGLDRATARLAGVPGALPFVLAMAEEANVDRRRVTVIQLIRLLMLLVALPGLLALVGVETKPAPSAGTSAGGIDAAFWELATLAVAGAAGGFLLERLKAPAPWLFGAILGAMAMTGSGTVTVALPVWLTLPGLAITGCMVGANFAGTARSELASMALAGLGASAVGALAALAVAYPVARLAGLPTAQVWLAYAPGGVDVMAVMALALGLDVAFVGAHHALRFLGLGLIVPIWMRGHLRRGGSA